MSASLTPPSRAAQIGTCPVGSLPVKIITSLMGRDTAELLTAVKAVADAAVDILEWRTDYFSDLSGSAQAEAARTLKAADARPLLWTLRTAKEGGEFECTDEEYCAVLRGVIAEAKIDAIDIELLRKGSALLVQEAHDAGITVVESYHNFSLTPDAETLASVFDAMAQSDADILKIAVMPQTPEDVLTLLSATVAARRLHDRPVISMAMGPLGAVTRAAGAVFGSCATFACIGKASAPGQLPVGKARDLSDLFAQGL